MRQIRVLDKSRVAPREARIGALQSDAGSKVKSLFRFPLFFDTAVAAAALAEAAAGAAAVTQWPMDAFAWMELAH